MQINVEKLEGLSRKLTVTLPPERFEKAFQERLGEIAKKTRIPGFRPGKAPIDVIEKRIGKTLQLEVASELMQSGFQQVIIDEKLRIAGSADVKPGKVVKGEPLEFEVFYEAYPEIEIADFSAAVIEKPRVEISEKDVENAVEKIKRQHAKWHDVTRSANRGDRVLIDFEGFIDKKPFPGGSAKNLHLELGSNEMIIGFEEALEGVNAGETRDINLTFPENYPFTNLAGQPVLFKVTIHKVEEAEQLELNDEFVKNLGLKDTKNLEDLKQKTHEGLQRELDHKVRAILKKQVLDKLMELNEVETPQSMINDEVKHLQDITRQQVMMQQGRRIQPEKINLPHDPYLPQAKKRVILGLLIAEIVKNYDLKLNKEAARKRVEEIVAQFPNSEEMANYYQNNKRLMSEIEASVLEEQVVDKLLELATTTEKEMDFDQVLKESRQIGE